MYSFIFGFLVWSTFECDSTSRRNPRFDSFESTTLKWRRRQVNLKKEAYLGVIKGSYKSRIYLVYNSKRTTNNWSVWQRIWSRKKEKRTHFCGRFFRLRLPLNSLMALRWMLVNFFYTTTIIILFEFRRISGSNNNV